MLMKYEQNSEYTYQDLREIPATGHKLSLWGQRF